MQQITSYLFANPQNGALLPWIGAVCAVCFLVGCTAWAMVGRAGLRPSRKRARKLRNIMFTAAVLGGLYVGARYAAVGFLNWRIFLYAIAGITAVRLALWALSMRSLAVEIVDEKQALRKQAYFKRAGTNRSRKRKRRRHHP